MGTINLSTLSTVTRLISHEFGDVLPLDPVQRAAASAVIANVNAATTDEVDLDLQLPIQAFILINVSQQWEDTQAHLWRSIQIAFNDLSLDAPTNWGPSMLILDLVIYV